MSNTQSIEQAAREYADNNGFRIIKDDDESAASNKYVIDAFLAGSSCSKGESAGLWRDAKDVPENPGTYHVKIKTSNLNEEPFPSIAIFTLGFWGTNNEVICWLDESPSTNPSYESICSQLLRANQRIKELEGDSKRFYQSIWDAAREHNYLPGTLMGSGNGYKHSSLQEWLNSHVSKNI